MPPASAELERCATTAAPDAPRGFEDKVMAVVRGEPTPRSGSLAWLLGPSAAGGGFGPLARVGALAATLVLAVAAALFVGQLADIVRTVGSGSPTPVVSPSPSASETVQPSPSISPVPSASETPQGTPVIGESPAATGHETPEDTEQETLDLSKTARASALR